MAWGLTALIGTGLHFLYDWMPFQLRGWGACFAGMLLMPALLLGIYYPLRAGFGVQTEVMPIVLYYLVLASGFWFTVRLSDCAALGRWAGVLLMGVGFYVACLVVFSVAAPPLPIFRS